VPLNISPPIFAPASSLLPTRDPGRLCAGLAVVIVAANATPPSRMMIEH
jgi:hypothetical protein